MTCRNNGVCSHCLVQGMPNRSDHLYLGTAAKQNINKNADRTDASWERILILLAVYSKLHDLNVLIKNIIQTRHRNYSII